MQLPKVYQEGIIEYHYGMDTEPEWPGMPKGTSIAEYEKLRKLYSIEHMKYLLKENGDEFTEEEMREAKELLEQTIQEYNEM